MTKKIDLTGQRFGKLIALNETEKRKSKNVVWLCKCDCGNLKEVGRDNLIRGHTRSCGCLYQTINQTHRDTRNGRAVRLYRIWRNMIQRCNNPNAHNYKWYGAQGVRVCLTWKKSYQIFKDWALSHGYMNGLTIDRINGNGDYEPRNCQWLTLTENLQKGGN